MRLPVSGSASSWSERSRICAPARTVVSSAISRSSPASSDRIVIACTVTSSSTLRSSSTALPSSALVESSPLSSGMTVPAAVVAGESIVCSVTAPALETTSSTMSM